MANPEHEAILRQGVEVWNQWRADNPYILPNLSGINLSGMDLRRANLQHALLDEANMFQTHLEGANLANANLLKSRLDLSFLEGALLNNAVLIRANLFGASLGKTGQLKGANLNEADLRQIDLSGANLTTASLFGANLTDAYLESANLTKATLTGSILIRANLRNADISGSRIYGISAWNLETENLKQSNLIITPHGEPEITVDNLEIAQFVYLLLNNAKLRSVIDTLTTKSVLILGRFTPERKAVLDGIREALRQHDYVPILFDFDKPTNRDLTETVMTLASLSRFVIADLSDPNSIPHELMSFVDKLFSVPVQGIFCPTDTHPNPYPMYEHLQRLPHVLPIYRYGTADGLLASLEKEVIRPAEEKIKVVRPSGSI